MPTQIPDEISDHASYLMKSAEIDAGTNIYDINTTRYSRPAERAVPAVKKRTKKKEGVASYYQEAEEDGQDS